MGPLVLIGRDKRREMPREGPDKGVEAEPGSSGKEPADHGPTSKGREPAAPDRERGASMDLGL